MIILNRVVILVLVSFSWCLDGNQSRIFLVSAAAGVVGVPCAWRPGAVAADVPPGARNRLCRSPLVLLRSRALVVAARAHPCSFRSRSGSVLESWHPMSAAGVCPTGIPRRWLL